MSIRPPEAAPPDPAAPLGDEHHAHWRANRRLTAVLLGVWFGVTFGVAFFARELDFDFFGWPFSFWMAAQGALVVYLLVVGCYAWRMHALDRAHGVAEPEH